MTTVAAAPTPPTQPAESPRGVSVAVDGVTWRHRGGGGVGPLSMHCQPGTVVALMGPNGAGKTTLLHLLAGLVRPQQGSVTWDGEGSPAAVRRRLGLGMDRTDEDATLSGRQAASFWCRQWLSRDATGEAVESLLQTFSLDSVGDHPVGTYSFGMRRRLSLVCALAHGPDLALLDEPTAGLDPQGATALTTLLAGRRRSGATTVVASNDARFTAATATTVMFLREGTILHAGAPAQLLATAGASRRAELRVEGTVDRERIGAVPGARVVTFTEDAAEVSLDAETSIAALTAAADHPGGRLRELRVRDTDLGDCFTQLTGGRLGEGTR